MKRGAGRAFVFGGLVAAAVTAGLACEDSNNGASSSLNLDAGQVGFDGNHPLTDSSPGPTPDASADAPTDAPPSGTLLWFRTGTPVDGGTFSSADFATADSAGNVYVSVRHQGPIDVGQGPVPGSGASGALLILKYDATGTLAWATPLPVNATGNLQTSGMAVDATGGVALVIENYSAAADFGTDAGAISGKRYVVKLAATGSVAWVKSYAGSFVVDGLTGQYNAQPVAVSPAGDIVFGGYFYNGVDFGAGTVSPTGATDAFVVGLYSDGRYRFARHWGTASANAMVNGAAFTKDGKVVLAGNLDAYAFDLGGGSLPAIGKADIYGNADGFVLVLDADGNYVRARRFGGAGATTTATMVAASESGFSIGGTFRGDTLDWGGGATLTAGDAGAGLALYAAMLDANLAHVWSHPYGDRDDGNLQFGGIGTTTSGNTVVTGTFANAIDFGDHAIDASADLGAAKGFVAELAPNDGHAVFSRSSNVATTTSGMTYVPAGAAGGGGIVASGYFHGTVDWGGAPNTTSQPTFFVVKLAQ